MIFCKIRITWKEKWLKKTSQEFRLKNRDETKNYFIEEISQNNLISKKNKKVWRSLNYINHLLNLASAVLFCVSVFALISSIVILIGVVCSAVGVKIPEINPRITKYKSIIKKKSRKHDKIVLLAKN